jgi:hypothetical protein
MKNYLLFTAVVLLLSLATEAHCQIFFPDAPSRTVDAQFLAVIGGNALATGSDAYTTVTRIGPDKTCVREVGNPELYGREPQVARTSIVMGSLFVASTLATYELKRHHAHIWKFPLWQAPAAYEAYGHGYGAIHNLKVCHI